MEQDLYHVLGVARTASAEEIKRAYYKRIRSHPPEKDPEGFKLLRRAYDTLSNQESRSNYDAIETYGDEIIELLNKADELVESKDFAGAVSKLKKIVVFAPHLDNVRDYLAFCLFMAGEYEKALQQMDILCNREEPSPYYLNSGGNLRLGWVQHLEDEDENKHKSKIKLLLLDALSLFKKAHVLESINAEPLLGISEVYMKTCDYDRALEYVEKAINADGKVDFQDFDAFYKGCIINLIKRDIPALRGMIRRIFTVVQPLDEEIADYVSWRFYDLADDLVGIHNYDCALELFQAAKKLCPRSEIDFDLPINYVKDMIGLSNEYDRLKDDDKEDSLIKYMLGSEYGFAIAKEEEKEEAQKQWDEMVKIMYSIYPEKILKVIERVKRECPTFYKNNEKFIDDLAEKKRAMFRFFDEALRAMKDSRLPEALRHISSLVHDLSLGLSEKEEAELIETLKVVARRVSQESATSIREGVRVIKSSYGVLYAVHEEMWDNLCSSAGTSRSWWQKLFD